MQSSDQPIQIHLGKFWPYNEILEVFVIGLELSLSVILHLRDSN